MEPQQRNLLLAAVLSGVILIGWTFLVDPPDRQLAKQPSSVSQSTPGQIPTTSTPNASTSGDVQNLQQTLDPGTKTAERASVAFKNDNVSGSINLRGGRIDDLFLSNYREDTTPESSPIRLLSPTGSPHPYFVESGFIVQNPATSRGSRGSSLLGRDQDWKSQPTSRTRSVPGAGNLIVSLIHQESAGYQLKKEVFLDDRFLFTVRDRITNQSDKPITLQHYALISRTDKPTLLGFYLLHEGLLGVFDGTLKEIDYDDVVDDGPWTHQGVGGWLGITDKYWLTALIPAQDTATRNRFLYGKGDDGRERWQSDLVQDSVTIAAGDSLEIQTRVFLGAKETTLLDSYGERYGIPSLDRAVDFGWFYFLTKPLFYALHWFNGLLGNFGLAILALTVCVKLVLFPLANKSYRSMSRMKLLSPKMQALKEKFSEDRQKLNQEVMGLYKREGVNPLAGCLPIVVQIPVFFALYKVLFVTIEMRHAPFFGWIHDLSAPDPLGLLTAFGFIMWDVPQILAIANIGIWPLIMGFTMWLQQKLNPPQTDPMQARIFGMFPYVFTFLLAGFPAGLVIYWAWNNSLSILQQWVIMKQTAKVMEQEKLSGGRRKKKSDG